ncbi:PA0069 family radical SAM protein [Ralstonia solanacearum]|uniref:PA0069 family radical SAM protein n=2 Tax=Ralstonia solanacearum TaxID=305 RepID=UPI001FF70181|nr:PA0069 family radical SAM protein [Ralstonia solanacearum]MDB0511687.1 PA0069 family radical SAM protein [Ralstonia solanacearum]MDB0516290.1 PA0069 family radical SAM protein [Ralstonia solanacearum]MDB0566146.1 PA0069 family radical SAM protein [Ralstonia solanacearum]MDB0574899.1 PA0069 family radical SAM protein [Ralstonia solanacearum]
MSSRPTLHRGRGALSNVESRFDEWSRSPDEDGVASAIEVHGEPSSPKTVVTIETAKSIISRNQSPDIPFDQSINVYRGCEHGCSYCFARPTHAYLGLSPGLDFETKLFAKPNAASLLRHELTKKSYVPSVIALGTNTDPYQPIERDFRLTRSILEVLEEFNHPVAITTKSSLVTRDADILERMAAKGLARVFISITTLDSEIARSLEPRANTPWKRLEGIRLLAERGIPTGVMVAPLIPALTDFDMEHVMKKAAEAGARTAGYVILRLPLEVRDIFLQWLEEHYPGRRRHVMSLIEQMREGKLNNAEFGKRMVGNGIFSELIRNRFKLACKRFGLNQQRPTLRLDLFLSPETSSQQGSLF